MSNTLVLNPSIQNNSNYQLKDAAVTDVKDKEGNSTIEDFEKFLLATADLIRFFPEVKKFGDLFRKTLGDLIHGDSKALRDDIQKFKEAGPAGKSFGHFLQEFGKLVKDLGEDIPGSSEVKDYIEKLGQLLHNVGQAITDQPEEENSSEKKLVHTHRTEIKDKVFKFAATHGALIQKAVQMWEERSWSKSTARRFA